MDDVVHMVAGMYCARCGRCSPYDSVFESESYVEMDRQVVDLQQAKDQKKHKKMTS